MSGWGGRKEGRGRSRKILITESEKCIQGPPDTMIMAEVPQKGLGQGHPNKKVSTWRHLGERCRYAHGWPLQQVRRTVPPPAHPHTPSGLPGKALVNACGQSRKITQRILDWSGYLNVFIKKLVKSIPVTAVCTERVTPKCLVNTCLSPHQNQTLRPEFKYK